MTRLIDADALHDDLRTKQRWVVHNGDKHNEGYTYDQVHFSIDEQPTIDAVPVKHGKWIDLDSQMYTRDCKCSECGYNRGTVDMLSTQGRYPRFCENCGADMSESK